jgi:hypothetical protein
MDQHTRVSAGNMHASRSMRESIRQPVALLCAQVLHPALYVMPVDYSFGQSHLDTSNSHHAAKTWVHLQNPTTVDAHWRLVHVPLPTATTRAARARQASALAIEGPYIDMPAVFRFEQSNGVVKGPTRAMASVIGRLPSTPIGGGRIPSMSIGGGRIPSTPIGGGRLPSSPISGGCLPSSLIGGGRQSLLMRSSRNTSHDRGAEGPSAVSVTFHPAAVARYRSRFRFELRGGQPGVVCDLLLEGTGTVDESGCTPAHRVLRIW